jgi:hypothetical protein
MPGHDEDGRGEVKPYPHASKAASMIASFTACAA